MKPGVYPNIAAFTYHQWEGASQSRLKILRDKSPAHLRYALDHPEPQTDAMRLGAAVHTCVLQPEAFATEYVRGIAGDGRTKRVKEARLALETAHPGKAVLAPSEWDTCMAIRRAVGEHPNTKHLLNGEREYSAVWTDPETGVLCKGRFDCVARGIFTLTDLKTTRDASPHRFPRDVYQLGYHIQAAHYIGGAKALGLDVDSFGFIAVEKEPPFAIAVYQLAAPAIHDGERELRPLLDTWARCLLTNEWPAYPTDVQIIDLPKWAPDHITQRVEAA